MKSNGVRVLARACLAIVAVVAFGSDALAQDDGVRRVETQLVTVDVVVSGDALAMVGLSEDDFSIYDEGEP